MPYCVKCGVELSDEATSCALCGTDVPEGFRPEDRPPGTDTWPGRPRTGRPAPPRAGRSGRSLASGIVTASLAIPFLLCLIIDLSDGTLTWSAYTSASLIFTWAVTVLPLRWPDRPWLLVTGLFILTGGYLFYLDRLSPGRPWFLELALPASVLVLITTILVLGTARRRPAGGVLRVIAWSTFYVAAFHVALGAVVQRYLDRPFPAGWSLIVLSVLLPLALLLGFLSGRSRLVTGLRKRFHL